MKPKACATALASAPRRVVRYLRISTPSLRPCNAFVERADAARAHGDPHGVVVDEVLANTGGRMHDGNA